ncbi:MAG: hypothetical protein ROR55_10760 [Devosia sp.]
MIGSFLASRLARHCAQNSVMLAGRVVACVGIVIGLVVLASGAVTPLLYFGCTILVGLGNGLTIPNSNAGVMAVSPRLAGSAAGITGAMTLAGGAVLATITGMVLANRPSPEDLLILMLVASSAGLLSAAFAIWLENRAVPSKVR